MKTIAVLTILVCICTGAEIAMAFDPWDDETIARHAVWTVLKVVDGLQTWKIAREPDKYHECNPLLGKHPEEWQVGVYFVSTYLAQTALVHVLPSEYRPWAQYFFIAASGTCVARNLSIGLNMGF